MTTTYTIDENQSDVLIKMKHNTISYLGGKTNHFNGFVAFDDNGVEDASVEFSLDNNYFSMQDSNDLSVVKSEVTKRPLIRFKSTSFQKIKNNINFLKGSLTIKDITKIVELDAEFMGINNYNGVQKATFEIKGDINRRDFGLDKNFNNSNENYRFGKDLKLIANLEFSI